MKHLGKLWVIPIMALLCFNQVKAQGIVEDNLAYINIYFALYNDYNTSWDVDTYNKTLICKDKFGTLKADYNDVEVRISDNGLHIGIYCLDGSVCIRAYDTDGNLKSSGYENYTMGLAGDDGELIENAPKIIEKFAEIKNYVVGSSTTVSTNKTLDQLTVEAEIQKINLLFQNYSQYKNQWSVDWNNMQLLGKTKSCTVVVPFSSQKTAYYYKRDGSYAYGYYISSNYEDIEENCTSFNDKVKKTYDYLSNYDADQQLIKSLNTIFETGYKIYKSSGSSSYTSSSSGVPTGSTLTGTMKTYLDYVNQQFATYNKYNTVFSFNTYTKQIIFKNDFGTNYADLDKVMARAVADNQWVGIYCIDNDSECISQRNTSGSDYSYKSYTMSMTDCPNLFEVARKINMIIDMILSQ